MLRGGADRESADNAPYIASKASRRTRTGPFGFLTDVVSFRWIPCETPRISAIFAAAGSTGIETGRGSG